MIVCGFLLGITFALVVYAVLVEALDADGSHAGIVATLAFVGASGTTVGIGVLVIIAGRILGILNRSRP